MAIIHSDVDIDKKTGEFKIRHDFDIGPCLRECYEARMSGTEGDIDHGKAKRIACIPRVYFYTDINLMLYSKLRGEDDKEAQKYMDKFLWEHPEFRTTTKHGRKGVM